MQRQAEKEQREYQQHVESRRLRDLHEVHQLGKQNTTMIDLNSMSMVNRGWYFDGRTGSSTASRELSTRKICSTGLRSFA